MICRNGKCMMLLCMWATSFVILLSIVPEIKASSIGIVESGNERDDLNKRGWNDVKGSWGKRGWEDLQGAWGKRAWERLNGSWGKRLTQNPEPEEDVDEISRGPGWAKFRGSWGSGGRRLGDLSYLKDGLAGKRAWDKFGNSWGKRYYDNDGESPLESY